MGSTPAPPAPPLTAHLTTMPHPSEAHHVNHEAINLGRDKVPFSKEVWARIDRAVSHEVHRTAVIPKFLPHLRVSHHTTNVEADVVLTSLGAGAGLLGAARGAAAAAPPVLNVDEGANIALIEASTEIALSQAQVHKENEKKGPGHHEAPHHDGHAGHADTAGHHGDHGHHSHHHHEPSSTAVMLARRAANLLTLARDAALITGANAFAGGPAGGPGNVLFTSQTVQTRGVPVDTGLTGIGGPAQTNVTQVVPVQPVNAAAGPPSIAAQYTTNTVAAINQAYALLAGNGYAGPYACVLHFYEYADTFSPLASTLVLPADRIKPLLEAGYYSSAVMPGAPNSANPNSPQTPNPGGRPLGFNAGSLGKDTAQAVGFVMSIGGDVAEFINGLDPVLAFSFLDPQGNYIFRLVTRFALKLSDVGAIVRLEFI
jgi:hypothetical protein